MNTHVDHYCLFNSPSVFVIEYFTLYVYLTLNRTLICSLFDVKIFSMAVQ